MAERTVRAELVLGIRGFAAGAQRAAATSSRLAATLEGHAEKNQAAYEEVGGALTKVGLAAGAAVALSVGAFARFDAQMSSVAAATGATTQEMELLREAAIQAGADTAFSATEAAQGVENLAKAGVSTADILGGGLSGALSLAAAGELEVADAAELAATAMTQFGLEGSQVEHVADLLAAAAGKAQGDVSDMGMALKQAGLVASQTGLSIEETTAGLAAFASAGLIGSDAGTSFKTMLQRLSAPSGEASDLMAELGIHAFDASGQFVGLSAVAGQLESSMGALTPAQRQAAMATIFGSDAVRAASVLYSQGTAGVNEWTHAVNESGFASETAAARLDNLMGDFEALGGSLETLFIGLGESGNAPLREMVQDITTLVNVFSDLPGPVKDAATTITAVTAVVGIAGGAVVLAIPKIAAFNATLAASGPAGAKAAAGIRGVMAAAGPVGLVLAGVGLVLAPLVNHWIDNRQAVEDYAASLDDVTGAVTDATEALAAQAVVASGADEDARALGLAADDVTRAVLGEEDALRLVNDAIAENRDRVTANARAQELAADGNLEGALAATEAYDAAGRLNDVLGDQTGRLADAREQSERLRDASIETGEASESMTEGTSAAGEALAEMAESAATTEDVLAGLSAELDAIFARFFSAQEASDAVESAFDGLGNEAAELAEEHGALSIAADNNSESALVLRNRMRDVTTSIFDELDAMAQQGASYDEIRSRADQRIGQLEAEGAKYGLAEGDIREYSLAIDAVPNQVRTAVETPGLDAALLGIQGLRRAAVNASGRYTLYFNQITQGSRPTNPFVSVAQADGGILKSFAGGGFERHSAQIARTRPGTVRVWAEPETGGEAYIPLAASKRSRSLEVWAETGRLLGALGEVQQAAASGPSAEAIASALAAELRAHPPEAPVYLDGRAISDAVGGHLARELTAGRAG